MPDYSCILRATGRVVRGFGRGSKELGIPTANMSEDVIENLPSTMRTGVYAGWAQVEDGPVHKMVMSLGWNPFYKNERKSLEVHILHKFPEDFYDSKMQIVVLKFLRVERDFGSLEDLIATIEADIEQASAFLDKPEFLKWKTDPIFRTGQHNGEV
ncbi:hypothetical protein SprV_0802527000 [Sparganum proliferum]